MEIKARHFMDGVDGIEPKKMTVDEVFMEALKLAEDAECPTADRDKTILKAIRQTPELIAQFSLEFKLEVITDWDYEVTFS